VARGSAAVVGTDPGPGRRTRPGPGNRTEPGPGSHLEPGPGSLLYLGTGRESVSIAARTESSLSLLGGEPLGEPLLTWWNFVARTPEEIIAAARDWGGGVRFGKISGCRGEPLAAPQVDAVRLARRANPSR